MVKYIVNKQVIFLPDEKKLLSIKDGTRFTILKSSACCLEVLLERQGQLVSHSELMVAGWGENAKRTLSNSAYYQSFVNLRNVLKKLGCPDNILMTIRGKGVRLNAYITVEKYEDSPQTDIESRHVAADDPASGLRHEEINDFTAEDSLLTEKESSDGRIAPVQLNKEDLVVHKKKKSVRFYQYSLAITLCLICTFAYFWRSHSFHHEFIIEGYAHVPGTPSCYFMDNRNINNNFAIDFVQRKGLVCKNYFKYFISYFSTSPRLTVFTCKKEASLKCDSTTYIVDKNEEN